MTTDVLRSVPGRMAALVISATDGARAALGSLLEDRERWREAARTAARRAVVELRRADDALARAAGEMESYLAAADVPRERQGRLERLLREAFFLDHAHGGGLVVNSGRLRRIRYLCTDVVVALAGILVCAAGFELTVQEPLLFGRPVLLLYAAAFAPFLLLGISALRGLSHELSERRAAPRPPRRSKSAAKKRLRTLKPKTRAA